MRGAGGPIRERGLPSRYEQRPADKLTKAACCSIHLSDFERRNVAAHCPLMAPIERAEAPAGIGTELETREMPVRVGIGLGRHGPSGVGANWEQHPALDGA